MGRRRSTCWSVVGLLLALGSSAPAQSGSIRGVVYDKDFDAPLPGALVEVFETGQSAETSDQGNYVIADVAPGTYTVVFSKEGYVRQLRPNVVVEAGKLAEVGASLAGDFTEMKEFIVQDALQMGTGSETALLALRLDSPAFLDSISADLMSRAGASDAASALRLVAGASVQDGKFAVIRGLPDRYVSSKLNGVRLPSADEETRAVELDQFPATVIESIQVSKTFTPDQQADASGGAVDILLKGIPREDFALFSAQYGFNDQVQQNDNDFLTYDGGGVDYWGDDGGDRHVQRNNLEAGAPWNGAVGVSRGDAPTDSKWSLAAGGKRDHADFTFGGLFSFFHEKDSSYYDDGEDNSLRLTGPGGKLEPLPVQGSFDENTARTALFDVTRATEAVQWGGLAAVGIENDEHALTATYLYTRTAEDTTTLAEDTRGKYHVYPGHDPNDPTSPGTGPEDFLNAPFIRTETLDYTERTTWTLQFSGRHTLPLLEESSIFGQPELGWTYANSAAELHQPDKREFGSLWVPAHYLPGGVNPPQVAPAQHQQYLPEPQAALGNLQRIFKDIEEESDQYSLYLKLPFEQWSGDEGYVKAGVFKDEVDRRFEEDTFTNAAVSTYQGEFDDLWSAVFPQDPTQSIFAWQNDVNYDGEQDLSAYYGMLDLPLTSRLSLLGGARVEATDISIENEPEPDATWITPEGVIENLDGDEADVSIQQTDVLPAVGLVYTPTDAVTIRTSYSKTIARPTFKELTPVPQSEFAGGPVFLGNPELQLSDVENYDIRVDYVPYEGGLLSASWFKKDLTDAIENVQRVGLFSYTTAVNFPEGELNGWELEARQDLGLLWDVLEGFSVGANATFIDSEVTLPEREQTLLASAGAPTEERDATNAPEHLYNVNITYDSPDTGTEVGLFYTVRGDTLVAGAGVDENAYIPDIYAKEFGTLNFTISQEIGRRTTLTFQAKNLTNPDIEEVYRSDFHEGEPTHTVYTAGREYSLALTVRF